MTKTSEKTKKKLKNRLLSYFQQESCSPVSQKELFSLLGIPPGEQALCTKLVSELLSEELIFVTKGLLKSPQEKKEDNILFGKLHVHPKGFGFVTPDDLQKHPQDIFIPRNHMHQAIDKDHVEVKFFKSQKKDKGPEGVIVSILERARKHLVATVQAKVGQNFLACCPILGDKKTLHITPLKNLPLKVGDRVLVHIDSSEQNTLLASPVKILGHISNASEDVSIAATEYDLEKNFPEPLLNSLKTLPKNPQKKYFEERIDLRDRETFTIDPETAKDFDDALSLTKDSKGHYHLIVHVADVSHYVKQDTLLDEEAFARGNSTYFPGCCLPMLPEALSNGLCSLKEKVPRLTVSVFMHFNPKGDLLDYDIKRAVIKSQKRFSYPEAKKVLDGFLESPHVKTLHLMVELCRLLQKKRYERGSVDLSLPEVSLKIDAQGEPTGFDIIEYDITHQLVEEFMLKANEIVAHALLARGVPAIYRIHEAPSPSDTEDFANVARSFGFKLKKSPGAEDIQALFKEAKSTPYLHQLSIAFIRSMKLAIYSEQNVGHFGLSLEHYTHFTSPIRRYSDLIVHRLLFETPLPPELLKKMAHHCSERERISFRAETSVVALKKLRLLHRLFEEDPNKIYTATLSKIKPFGLFFELSDLMLEGFIHISEIGDDYYLYQEKSCALEGQDTHERFQIGDRLQVSLVNLDLISQETLWQIHRTTNKKKKKKNR